MRTTAHIILFLKHSLVLFFCLALMTSCSATAKLPYEQNYSPANHSRLAVIGVSKEVKDKDFEDLRVGFGLKNMLTEELYDTGKFTLVEEKKGIRGKLGLSEKQMWEQGVSFSSERLQEIARALDVDNVAYAVVRSYKVPRSGMSAGFYSRKKAMARLEIKVCIYEKATGKLFCRAGKGSADDVADGLFVEYKDNGRLSTKSLIGKASKEAIQDALEKLIPQS